MLLGDLIQLYTYTEEEQSSLAGCDWTADRLNLFNLAIRKLLNLNPWVFMVELRYSALFLSAML